MEGTSEAGYVDTWLEDDDLRVSCKYLRLGQ